MSTYSIKELSIISGVKAHTIRIWEKRYNLFTPTRTSTNIRRYTDEELRRILNVSTLLSMGYKISRIANLSEDEIHVLVSEGNKYVQPPAIPEVLLSSIIEFDQRTIIEKIEKTVDSKGLELAYEKLLLPLLVRLGMLWQAKTITPAHEHFTSNIIRQILIHRTQLLPKPSINAPKALFFLPEGEWHELGLLFFNYLALKEGYNSLYLGQSVPLDAIKEATVQHDFAVVFTSLTRSFKFSEIKDIFDFLKTTFNNSSIVASGLQIQTNKDIVPNGIHTVSTANQFKELLRSQAKAKKY